LLNKLGCTIGAGFQLSALTVSVFAFRWITGSWQHVWVLCLPFIALIIPGVIIAVIASTIWPDEEVRLPSTLALPKWFRSLPHYRMMRHPEGHVIFSMGSSDMEPEEENTDKKERPT
jgi:hypothetical protein